jgi:hypothetical protein
MGSLETCTNIYKYKNKSNFLKNELYSYLFTYLFTYLFIFVKEIANFWRAEQQKDSGKSDSFYSLDAW